MRVHSPMHKLWVRQRAAQCQHAVQPKEEICFLAHLSLAAATGTCAALLGVFRVWESSDPGALRSTGCWFSAWQLTVPVLQLSPRIFASSALSWLEKPVHSLCTGNLNLARLVSAGWWWSGCSSSPASFRIPGLSISLPHYLTPEQYLKPSHQIQLASSHETLFWNDRS